MNPFGSNPEQDRQLDEVYHQLTRVIDPEIGLSIIKLGLVYDIGLKDGAVSVTMTLTTPGCPMGGPITDGVRSVVRELPWVRDVDVNVVWEPAWSPAMIR